MTNYHTFTTDDHNTVYYLDCNARHFYAGDTVLACNESIRMFIYDENADTI